MGDVLDEDDRIMNEVKGLGRVLLIGNLPFSIAGTLLSKWTKESLENFGVFQSPNVEMTLMFTEKVAKRLLFLDCKRTKFAVITNIAFEISFDTLFPKTSFFPNPSEDCISLKFKKKLSPFENALEADSFMEFMNLVYRTPNKNLSNAFKDIKNWEGLVNEANVNPNCKIHEVTSKQILQIFKSHYSNKTN
jgi:16S rRNA A1518/A1519 N6-dimethyltransferase RsmA/KsgA/DIM1 with predicted DNA glycosylase/AP lyase activity